MSVKASHFGVGVHFASFIIFYRSDRTTSSLIASIILYESGDEFVQYNLMIIRSATVVSSWVSATASHFGLGVHFGLVLRFYHSDQTASCSIVSIVSNESSDKFVHCNQTINRGAKNF